MYCQNLERRHFQVLLHFHPTGINYTTGLSHNHSTWLPLLDRKNNMPKK